MNQTYGIYGFPLPLGFIGGQLVNIVCERPLRGIWPSFSCLEPNMAFLPRLLKTRIKNETSNRLCPHCVDLGGDGVAYLNTNIEGKDTPSRAKSDHLFSPDKRA